VDNLIGSTDRNGRRTRFTYDNLDRLTAEDWLNSTGVSTRTITSTYDTGSRLTSITDPAATYRYQYDAADRLVSVDNSGSPSIPNVVFNYGYDAVGNRIWTIDTISGIQRGTTSFDYDELNRTSVIAQIGSNVTEKLVRFTYNAASELTSVMRYPSVSVPQVAVTSTYGYDLNGRLTSLTHQNSTGALAAYTYAYDAANRLTQFNTSTNNSTYRYDSRGQLLGNDNSTQPDETYSYDGNGNRTNTGYQTGSNNRLLSDGVYNYTYDNEGNRTRRTNIATGEVTDYSWDYHNRLTRVVVRATAGGTITRQADYTYDTLDRRIAKRIDANGAAAGGVSTERYVYDGEHIALVFDGNNTLKQRYLHGPAIDQVLAEDTGNQTHWLLTDHQGSVRQITDSAGVLLNQIDYDSYGNITSQSNPSVTYRFGYTGREWDGETGQYYYRARYYDQSIGRFLSQDPIGFTAGDANLYRYVFNSPTNFTDPSGMIAPFILAALGGVALFIISDLNSPRIAHAPRHRCDIARDVFDFQRRLESLSPSPIGMVSTGGAGISGLTDDMARGADDLARGINGTADDASRAANRPRLPDQSGAWDGSPGNSNWHSTDPNVTRVTGGEPIPFRGNYPDFSRWSKGDVRIPTVTGKTTTDNRAADQAFALQQGWLKKNGTPNGAMSERYRTGNNLTWHHIPNSNNLQLLPRGLHGNIPHTGSAAQVRNGNSR
jgi:RHS repeat-associated protein